MRSGLSATAVALSLLLHASPSIAEEDRSQYPSFLAHSYFDVGVGYLDYPFTGRQLEPGFTAESVSIPHVGARLVLLGYRFTDHLAAQLSYTRPVEWVKYRNVNGVVADRSVWMNLSGFTLRGNLPLFGPWSLDGEGGVTLVVRHGFGADAIPIVRDADYWAPLYGGGLRYRLNDTWDLNVNAVYSPATASVRQPHTLAVTGGFTFNMRPLSESQVAESASSGFAFPANLLQVGYSSDVAGFGVNRVVSGGGVPIFWGGIAQVRQGVIGRYHRNVFHTRRLFSLDVGTSVSYWRSRANHEPFYTFSLFPEFRFTPVRLKSSDFYINYSLLGPATISRVTIDGNDTGRHFTFEDFMGIGTYLGKDRHVNAEIHIGHFSNANVLPRNAGLSIPLTFTVGYAFD
jgi:hypothetical protein